MPNKAAQGYHYDKSTETLTPKDVPDAMKRGIGSRFIR